MKKWRASKTTGPTVAEELSALKAAVRMLIESKSFADESRKALRNALSEIQWLRMYIRDRHNDTDKWMTDMDEKLGAAQAKILEAVK